MFQDTGPEGIHDWSSGDWMSTMVLGPYAARHPRLEGRRRIARRLLEWARLGPGSGSVWMRRAGLVSFVNLVSARHVQGGGGEGGSARGGGGSGGGRDGGGAGRCSSGVEGRTSMDTAGSTWRPPRVATAVRQSNCDVGPCEGEGDRPAPSSAHGGDVTAAAATTTTTTTTTGAALEVREARGGDELFGEGFVVELSAACGSAIGQCGGATFDVDADLAAWVQTAAQWMLSLCARETRRMDAIDAKRKRLRSQQTSPATEGDEREAEEHVTGKRSRGFRCR